MPLFTFCSVGQRTICGFQDLHHRNVVELKGAFRDPGLALVLEFVPKGSLEAYLVGKKNSITPAELLQFSEDVCNVSRLSRFFFAPDFFSFRDGTFFFY